MPQQNPASTRASVPQFSNNLARKVVFLLIFTALLPGILLVIAAMLAAQNVPHTPSFSLYALAIILQPVFLIGLVLSLLIAGVAIRSVFQTSITRIDPLVRYAEKIARGDWSERMPILGNDEIGSLSHSLNQIKNDLGKMYRQLERQSIVSTTDSQYGLAEAGMISLPEEIEPENNFPNLLAEDILLDTLQLDRQEAYLFYKATQSISQTQDEAEVFRILDEALARANFSFGIFDVARDSLRLVKLIDRHSQSSDTALRGISLNLTGSALKLAEKECLIFDDLTQQNEYLSVFSFFLERGCTSIAIFPIFVNRSPVRVIILASRLKNRLSTIDVQPYINLAQITGNILTNIFAHHNVQNRLDAYETLAVVSQAITVEFNTQRLYQLVHEKITDRMGGDLSFLIAIYDHNTRHIQIPYLFEGETATSLDSFPLGEGLTSILIETRKSLMLVHNTEQEAQRLGAKIVGKPARSWLGVPLLLGGDVIGAIILQDSEREGRFTERDLRLVEALAPQVAIAIRNAQLIKDMSETLTAYDQERTLLNALLDNVPEKIYFKDREGRYTRVSNSILLEFGAASDQELIGKTDEEIIPGEIGYLRHNDDMLIISSAQPSIGQLVEHIADNGQSLWELVSRVPLVDEQGHAYGLLAIAQDISDLKKAEMVTARQAQYLYTAAEIARDVTGTLELQQILQNTTNLVRERFGYYHASVFLVDPLNQFAILEEASGDIGQVMKRTGHRLAVGSKSLVGQSTLAKETVIANNVRSRPDYYPNPLLPDTRSELVVPLKVGAAVLGALDVQSDQVNAFSTEDVRTLEILADQLALTIENANLYAKAQENLAKHRLLHQITTAASTSNDLAEALDRIVTSLQTALGGDRILVYFLNQDEQLVVQAVAGYENMDFSDHRCHLGEGFIGLAALEKRPVRVSDISNQPQFSALDPSVRSMLAVPILFSDKLLGVLDIESLLPARFDENDQEIIAALGNSLGGIIANTQLVSQIRQQVERQRQLYDITSKIRRSVDIETILKTSVSEIGRVVGARSARIELSLPKDEPDQSSGSVLKNEMDSTVAHRKNGKHASRGEIRS